MPSTIDTDTFELDYDNRSGNYTAEFHGLTIIAKNEQGPSNPWEDWDGQVPMAYADYGDRKPTVHDSGCDILRPFNRMTDGFLIHHQRALCDILDIDHDECVNEIQNNIAYERRTYSRVTFSRAEYWRDTFVQSLGDRTAVKTLEALSDIYDLMKIENYLGTTRGYSQGDQLEVLCVAFPDWKEKHAIKKPYGVDQFKGDVELLGDWAWGNVYYYVIEDEDGETLESCGGFYGTDFDKSGLMDEALPAARREAKKRYEAQAEGIQAERPDMYADAE